MQHLGPMKRILCYVARTLDYGIHYAHVKEFKLAGYIDNDWGSSLDDRRTTSGSTMVGSGAIT